MQKLEFKRPRENPAKRKGASRENRTKINLNQAFEFLTYLRNRLDKVTGWFHLSTPLVNYRVDDADIRFDLRDIILMAAINPADVLLTGKTGVGKTGFANSVMEALYGKSNYFSKTTLPSMNVSEFMDMDFAGIVKGEKSLQQAISGIISLSHPGIVLNEINRAPTIIQTLLIPLLDNDLEIQGVKVDLGVAWKNGRYQFRILTINENGSYQVQEIDPAIRDRMTIEIPLDIFPQTRGDVLHMLAGNHFTNERQNNAFDLEENSLDKILWLKLLNERIELTRQANMFLCYLTGLSFCIRAPQGTKESVTLTTDFCDGCHHYARFYNICGNIMAPSSRNILKLKQLAQSFSLFRAWKTGSETIVVTRADIIEAAPFVFYSKLSLNPLWIRNAGNGTRIFSGDRWTAIKAVLKWIDRERFSPLVNKRKIFGDLLWEPEFQADKQYRELFKKMYKYLNNEDPWAFNPAVIKAYLDRTR